MLRTSTKIEGGKFESKKGKGVIAIIAIKGNRREMGSENKKKEEEKNFEENAESSGASFPILSRFFLSRRREGRRKRMREEKGSCAPLLKQGE